MVSRADLVAPVWKTEPATVSGLTPDGQAVDVTIKWLDAGARWRLSQLDSPDPSLRMFEAVSVVVVGDDGEPLMDAKGWQAWSTNVSNLECVELLDKALIAAGLRGGAEKK